MQRRTGLVRCDGTAARKSAHLELYEARYATDEAWLASGALASEVLPLLETLAATEGLQLVCITPELADARRAARAEQTRH